MDLSPNRIARLAGSTRSGMVLEQNYWGSLAAVSLGAPILTGTDRAHCAFQFQAPGPTSEPLL
jgi:hypothetical protein